MSNLKNHPKWVQEGRERHWYEGVGGRVLIENVELRERLEASKDLDEILASYYPAKRAFMRIALRQLSVEDQASIPKLASKLEGELFNAKAV